MVEYLFGMHQKWCIFYSSPLTKILLFWCILINIRTFLFCHGFSTFIWYWSLVIYIVHTYEFVVIVITVSKTRCIHNSKRGAIQKPVSNGIFGVFCTRICTRADRKGAIVAIRGFTKEYIGKGWFSYTCCPKYDQSWIRKGSISR